MASGAGLQVGVRVVRGPDWKWASQDEGEGHVGTVIEIGRPGSKASPDKTVVVQWDSGNKTNYRVGYQGAYDLRLFDNAPAGVRHPEHMCNQCKQMGIAGIRWRCTKCQDYDLCTPCYNAAHHELHHIFMRYTTPNSKGVKVSARQGVTPIEAKGIFAGAKVERGPSWDWGNQDGGDGKLGKVIDIRGWDAETERSVANVMWHSGTSNVYRLGHKGKVDLKYRTAAGGGHYYSEHLPILGEHTEQILAALPPCPFKVGDKVKVDMEPDALKVMQEGHGGWNPKMAEFIGKVGLVHRITDRGDIRIQYEGCTNRWTFHPGALTKIVCYNVGDAVMVTHDLDKVKELQAGHGEWNDTMAQALGKVGKVVKVYSDGDMRVCINGQTWTFNSLCCVPRPQDQQRIDNTTSLEDTPGCSKSSTAVASNTEDSIVTQAASMLDQILLVEQDPACPESLVKEAAQGHLEAVEDILSKHSDQVNSKSAGKTALQVASHQGNKDIVLLLLKVKADIEVKDDDGDTSLHYTAFGNQPEIMQILLDNGANINSVNNGGCSTLHVAVNKQHLDCVKVLLQHNCDVNIQDTYGDTAQHDAIGKDNRDIVTLLSEHQDTNFMLKNTRGFNALHHAALKGNAYATGKILSRAHDMVDVKKDDGFSALHLAALNGHCHVAQVLLTVGNAQLEIRNNRQQTPLMLAVTQGHVAVVHLLVEAGADVLAADEDGNCCLHLALLRLGNSKSAASNGDNGNDVQQSEETSSSLSVQICRYLVEHSADVMHKDCKGRTPLDLAAADPPLLEYLRQFKKVQIPVECIVCNDDEATVSFQPCGHKIACTDCCMKMKKCLSCQSPIERKLNADGTEVVAANVPRQPITEDSDDLKKKLQEYEDTLMCNICLDRKRNIAFLCGHSACNECAIPLKQCHMCRKPITKRINLFV